MAGSGRQIVVNSWVFSEEGYMQLAKLYKLLAISCCLGLVLCTPRNDAFAASSESINPAKEVFVVSVVGPIIRRPTTEHPDDKKLLDTCEYCTFLGNREGEDDCSKACELKATTPLLTNPDIRKW